MTSKPAIIFDASGWNRLLDDPNLDSLQAGLEAEFFVRLTGTNVSEITATPNSTRRTSLLHLCRTLADDHLFPYHWITNKLIASYSRDPNAFDWWNVLVEWPELEKELVRMEIFDDDLAKSQRNDHEGLGRDFKDLYTRGRDVLEEAFKHEPEARPANFADYLKTLQDAPGEFWKMGQSFYQGPAKEEPDEATIKKFIDICPPFRALIVAACIPQYEYWMRNLITSPKSYRAGAADIFSAVYLPYCSKFVTHDDRQLNALKPVALHRNLESVEVLSYQDSTTPLDWQPQVRKCLLTSIVPPEKNFPSPIPQRSLPTEDRACRNW